MEYGTLDYKKQRQFFMGSKLWGITAAFHKTPFKAQILERTREIRNEDSSNCSESEIEERNGFKWVLKTKLNVETKGLQNCHCFMTKIRSGK
jgi:hypothetical protein